MSHFERLIFGLLMGDQCFRHPLFKITPDPMSDMESPSKIVGMRDANFLKELVHLFEFESSSNEDWSSRIEVVTRTHNIILDG